VNRIQIKTLPVNTPVRCTLYMWKATEGEEEASWRALTRLWVQIVHFLYCCVHIPGLDRSSDLHALLSSMGGRWGKGCGRGSHLVGGGSQSYLFYIY